MTKYTVDWTTAHKQNFEPLLKDFKGKENISFLEIGVWEGRTTKYLIDEFLTTDTAKLYAIDNGPKEIFYQNLAKEIDAKKLVFEKERSIHCLSKYICEGVKFDFIYVDASHLMKNVLEDIILSFNVLKEGGIMLMDDYPWDNYDYLKSIYDLKDINEKDYDSLVPKKAIDAFLKAYQFEIEILIKDYQVAIRKKESFETKYTRKTPLRYEF